jgi:hypothetical protein
MFPLAPGIDFEADDSLTPATMGKFMSALNDGMNRLVQRGDTTRKVRVWKGRLILQGTAQGYVYEVICPRCPFAKEPSDAEPETEPLP